MKNLLIGLVGLILIFTFTGLGVAHSSVDMQNELVTDKSKCSAKAHKDDVRKCTACIAGRGKWDTSKRRCKY